MSTREDCPKCAGVKTLNVMEGLLEMQRYCTACGLDETCPTGSAEPLPWSRPGADPVTDEPVKVLSAPVTEEHAADLTVAARVWQGMCRDFLDDLFIRSGIVEPQPPAVNATSLATVRKAIADITWRDRINSGTVDNPTRVLVHPKHQEAAQGLERPGLEVLTSPLMPEGEAWVAAPTEGWGPVPEPMTFEQHGNALRASIRQALPPLSVTRITGL